MLDYPELFHSINQARSLILTVRGAHGKTARIAKKHLQVREKQTAGWTPAFPPSSAEPWVAVELPTPGVVLVMSDFHVPYHDQTAIDRTIKFVKRKHKITDLVLNGDYGDWYTVSRFQRSPLKRSLHDEIMLQRDGLVYLAEQFPKVRSKTFKKGNHDVRWEHWVWNHAAEMADCEHMDFGAILKLPNYGYELVGDNPIMAGKLPILHGHELGKQLSAPVNPARGAIMRTNYTVLIGHHHQTSTQPMSNMWHDEIFGFSQGCLCGLEPEYARINKWNHGFAVVEVDKDGMFNLINYRIGTRGAVRAS